MSTEIYYFSGTGNSLHVARELGKHIFETKLIPIVDFLYQDIIEAHGETVGFVLPVYCHTVPVIVKNFIKKVDLKPARYIFTVVTTAATQCRAFIEIDKVLKTKRKRLNSYFTLKMPHNMPFYLHYEQLIAKEIIAKLESDAGER